MELNKDKIRFRVMVTFPDLLRERINKHNELYKTDFKIVAIHEDNVPFCDIETSITDLAQIFNLGYGLAVLQRKKKDEGEITW